jgi:acyl-CoA thioesterase
MPAETATVPAARDPARHALDADTRLRPDGPGCWSGRVDPAWNIGENPNGGYLLALAASALRAAAPRHPDPLSVTVHYLRPGLAGRDCTVRVDVLREGRTLTTARATLLQAGEPRLELLAALGDLGAVAEPQLTLPMPALPAPPDCAERSPHEQGVALSILDRLEIRLDPREARAGAAGDAQVSGWIRLRDGREPDTLASLLFVDAFPPAVFGLHGRVGWVPTVELTVHLRARPAPGWMLGRFRTDDLAGGRLIEDGALWDARGRLVARSRQLALVRQA